jgi:hypothetical protein
LRIIKPDGRYRGRSYSEWIQEWSNLLVSSSPDYQTASDMFFLRGNIDYKADQSGNRTIKPGKFYDRTGSLGQTVYSNTALFIPVMTAMYSLNDPYEAKQLLDEVDLHYAVRTDLTEGGEMWLRVKNSPAPAGYGPVIQVPDKMENYYFETAPFTLRISNQSPLLNKFESSLGPGEYETVTGGYFVILSDLAQGSYRFHFGTNGRGYYYTDAVYDITVVPDKFRNLAKDVSTKDLTPGKTPKIIENQDNEKKTYRHLKTEHDIENTTPFT